MQTIIVKDETFNIELGSVYVKFSGGEFIDECRFDIIDKGVVNWFVRLPAESKYFEFIMPELKEAFIEKLRESGYLQ